jgi:hypothetical protein
MCELLSSTFATNFAAQPHQIPSVFFEEHNAALDYDSELNIIIEERLVYQVLSAHNRSAAGPDNIPGIMLNELAGPITRPLTIIFQQSLFTGKIPNI